MDTMGDPDDSRTASALVAVAGVSMFERLASDPNVPVEKLERLIAMQERILAHNAKAAFDADFAKMQGELPIVVERGKGNTGSYARLEDIVATVRPVLTKFGFSLSHTSEWPAEKTVKIVGVLGHRDGHEKRSEFLTTADTSGSKNAIQGLGSALSYGRRYTTLDLLGIATCNEDDDGKLAGRKTEQPPAPKGYSDWVDNLEAVADEGFQRLQDTWTKSKPEFRDYLSKYDNPKIEALKTKARRVAAS